MKIFLPTKKLFFVTVIMQLLLCSSVYAIAWKLSKNFWSEEDELVYENFVAQIGNSKHGNLTRFIRDPKANPLYGEEDKKFYLYADCADLPYLIRAYVAYKLRLPFGYVSSIATKGRDQRYGHGNRPREFKDQDYFSSPQKLFGQVTLINSGYFRMAVEVENSDHYPVKIQPESIKPGTIYYDPDGHIAIVYKVTSDGRIRVIDGHPDHTISKPWFGKKFTRGSKKTGGGFKRWRPLRYTSDGQIRRTSNHNIADYSAEDQFQKSYSYKGRQNLSYYDYLRLRLAGSNERLDPVKDFAFMMADLYEDISYRALAVKICSEKGINKRPHPGSLPWNIYGTEGIWEEFSTPSRDARLKVAFKDFYERTKDMVLAAHRQNPGQAQQLARQLLEKYHALSARLSIDYHDSRGNKRVLDFDQVSNRLFRFSFDPYHSIEYRWGADVSELALSPDNHTKKRFYELEYRLRNQIERVYNKPTPLSMGPEKPPEVRVRVWLQAYLQGHVLEPETLQVAAIPAAKTDSPVLATAPAIIQELKAQKLALAKISEPVKVPDTKTEVLAQTDLEAETKAAITPEPVLADLAEDIYGLCDDFVGLIVANLSRTEFQIKDTEN
jgi:hypothetical protein